MHVLFTLTTESPVRKAFLRSRHVVDDGPGASLLLRQVGHDRSAKFRYDSLRMGWAALSGRHGVTSAAGPWDDWHDVAEFAVVLMRRPDTPSGANPRGLRRRASRWTWLVLTGVMVIAGVVVLNDARRSQGPARRLCTHPVLPARLAPPVLLPHGHAPTRKPDHGHVASQICGVRPNTSYQLFGVRYSSVLKPPRAYLSYSAHGRVMLSTRCAPRQRANWSSRARFSARRRVISSR